MLKSNRIIASKQQLSADMQGEAVILDLESGTYFGLNQVGTRIWELVQQPISVQAIQDTILAEFDVEPERCEKDIEALLVKLSNAGLIQVVDAENP